MKSMSRLIRVFAPCALLLQWVLASSSFAASPTVAPAPAQESAAVEPQSNPATVNRQAPASAAPAEERAAAPSDQEPDATQQESPSAAEGKASPQRFVPSEQVRADFDVSFPIDT